MNSKNNAYNLVHITTHGEYKTPLVASQLFDQAELQATTKDGYAPGRTEAWIIGAFNEYYDKTAQQKVASLRKRCPHINIKMLNGIGRLNNFPLPQLLNLQRQSLGKAIPVIYHCRGEAAAAWAQKLRAKFPNDKVILDVRGYWPAESIYRWGIEDPAMATGQHLADYNIAHNHLKEAINGADGVTTVSDALKKLLIDTAGAPKDTYVIPCCVNHITDDSKRKEMRTQMGIADNEIVVVYSGTTAAYQHLDDLTIPFMKALSALNNKIRLAFFSSEEGKIRTMLEKAGMDTQNIVIRNFQQHEVGAALTACDAGILIRRPTLVNRVANPVKIAEYLAAGLPIIIENGVGGVADQLFEQSLLKGVEIANAGTDISAEAKSVNDWLIQDNAGRRQRTRAYAKEVYYWPSAIQISRQLYSSRLNKQ